MHICYHTAMSKADEQREARRIYVEDGRPVSRIAAILDRSRNTISNWKKADAERGADWELLRSQYVRKSPFAILQMLEARLEYHVEHEQESRGEDGWEDRVYKLRKVIEWERERIGGADQVMSGLRAFVAWATGQLPDEDINRLRGQVEMCFDDLRTGKFKLPS